MYSMCSCRMEHSKFVSSTSHSRYVAIEKETRCGSWNESFPSFLPNHSPSLGFAAWSKRATEASGIELDRGILLCINTYFEFKLINVHSLRNAATFF